jgi:peptidoglycan/xylan/chitin deacetylase (PgdA/CDA1 family)
VVAVAGLCVIQAAYAGSAQMRTQIATEPADGQYAYDAVFNVKTYYLMRKGEAVYPAYLYAISKDRRYIDQDLFRNGKWVQDAILPAKILPNAGKTTGHNWEARFTPTAAEIGCTVAFYAMHSDSTRVSGATPSVYRKVLCPSDAKVVALTFDDGPWPSQTQSVLDILKANGVKATFFQVGQCVDARPELSRSLLANGMLLGNHTETHLLLGSRSYSTAYAEIANGQASIKKATTFTPRWFRPPGGSTSGTVEDAAGDLGLRTILWSVDPRDWERPSVTTICSRVLSQVRPGAVVLMHDGGGTRTGTIGALAPIIRELKRQGYTFLTLDQMPRAEGTGRYPL